MNPNKVFTFAINKLSTDLKPELIYHSVFHTLDVYRTVEKLAKSEKLNRTDSDIVKTAALMHDIGFISQYKDHEEVSAEFARKHLPDFEYTSEEIELVASIIMKTKLPQNAVTLTEKILCDADLDYLGRPDFFIISHKLRLEWEKTGIQKLRLKEWYQMQYKFLSEHRFFTQSSIKLREKTKQKNIAEIKVLLDL